MVSVIFGSLSHVCRTSLETHATAFSIPACLRMLMPMLTWQDPQSPGSASGPTGGSEGAGCYGGVSRTWRPQISFTCWFLLLTAAGCNMLESIWFSSNLQKKKHIFPEGWYSCGLEKLWAPQGQIATRLFFLSPCCTLLGPLS